MARARLAMPDRVALRALIDGEGRLALRATPNARHAGIAIEDGRLTVRVSAVAADGQANRAVIALVARALDIAPSRITLLRGAAARDKVLRIAD